MLVVVQLNDSTSNPEQTLEFEKLESYEQLQTQICNSFSLNDSAEMRWLDDEDDWVCLGGAEDFKEMMFVMDSFSSSTIRIQVNAVCEKAPEGPQVAPQLQNLSAAVQVVASPEVAPHVPNLSVAIELASEPPALIARQVEVGPLWGQAHAQKVAAEYLAAHPGHEWDGHWWTTVSKEMSILHIHMLPDEDVATWRPEVIEEDPEADAFEFHDADEVPDDEDAEAAAIVNDIRGKVAAAVSEAQTGFPGTRQVWHSVVADGQRSYDRLPTLDHTKMELESKWNEMPAKEEVAEKLRNEVDNGFQTPRDLANQGREAAQEIVDGLKAKLAEEYAEDFPASRHLANEAKAATIKASAVARVAIKQLGDGARPVVDEVVTPRLANATEAAKVHFEAAKPHVSCAIDKVSSGIETAKPHVANAIEAARPHVSNALEVAKTVGGNLFSFLGHMVAPKPSEADSVPNDHEAIHLAEAAALAQEKTVLDSDDVGMLVGMGFGGDAAAEALRQAGGNVERALDALLVTAEETSEADARSTAEAEAAAVEATKVELEAWQPKLDALCEMGFEDTEAGLVALRAADGAVKEAVKILVAEERAARAVDNVD